MKKSKIVLKQSKIETDLYSVIELTNRTTPTIGSTVRVKEVEKLNLDRNLTIIIR